MTTPTGSKPALTTLVTTGAELQRVDPEKVSTSEQGAVAPTLTIEELKTAKNLKRLEEINTQLIALKARKSTKEELDGGLLFAAVFPMDFQPLTEEIVREVAANHKELEGILRQIELLEAEANSILSPVIQEMTIRRYFTFLGCLGTIWN